MDSFELNKIMGAVLATCLGLLTLNIAAGAVFAPTKLEKPGYVIAVPDKPGAATDTAKAEPAEPIAVRLASSDAGKGQAAAKQCAACHTFEKGGPNRVGPNLYGIVDRARASVAGFNYSAAMKAKGGTWTYEDLDTFIANPKAAIPGTSMGYAGLARGGQRADLINYLHTLSDNPVPLPKAAEAAPAEKK
ncbi:cytochrome c family protein [Pseudorhodoplanes sp.]|uniref:c-type cytochrome n=1 Tax=Pseudorhodoplanes sp. TaxID=1934341 RepID=UPI002BBFC9D2|nr:cytochrome c family protein [Pseudorhodoplanes sp.]HWV51959.1 cytochrome c family protein [Pseudorhodoplanes sp.]